MNIEYFKNFRFDLQTSRIIGYTSANLDQVRESINNLAVVVLKGVFEEKAMLGLRERIHQYFLNNVSSNPNIDDSAPNYWRRDDNPSKAAVKRANQFYSSFYWNEDLCGEQAFLQSMSKLKHELARLPEDFTFHGICNDYITYPTVTHFPLGGGYLNTHTDPENIQFCVINAIMSSRGKDYQEGGLFVEYEGQREDIDGILEVGDVYLINPNMVHGVAPIDPSYKSFQWGNPLGRWTLFPSLIEIKTTQGVKVEGLVDLGR